MGGQTAPVSFNDPYQLDISELTTGPLPPAAFEHAVSTREQESDLPPLPETAPLKQVSFWRRLFRMG